MPTLKNIEVKNLYLDLNNYRTLPQKNEQNAIKAMIKIREKKFLGILNSILDTGFLLNENLHVEVRNNVNIVREGNRRLACLKLIHRIYNPSEFNLSDDIVVRINSLPKKWLKKNSKVPCLVYKNSELDQIEMNINLIHAKGEVASRDPWTSVARARRNRDQYQMNEPALDILETFIGIDDEINESVKEEWSGDYPLSVLDEAIKKLAPRVGFSNSIDLANGYPTKTKKVKIGELVSDIGYRNLKFPDIRSKVNDFAVKYGASVVPDGVSNGSSTNSSDNKGGGSNTTNRGSNNEGSGSTNSGTRTSSNSTTSSQTTPSGKDPKHVRNTLKKFNPIGTDRQKVVELRDEMIKITLSRTPLAFCFLLRSAFEISAKGYCKDNNLSTTKNGREKNLTDLLRQVTNHLTNGMKDKNMVKTIHGAMSNLAENDRILSVTSMNQLVHNPNFSISTTDVVTMFGNVFPLLEKMNS